MKNLTDLVKDWADARKKLQQSVDSIPRIAGVIAVKIIKENFIGEEYDSGIGTTKWKPRKASTNAQYDAGKIRNSKTGKLSKYRSGKNGNYKGSVYSSSNPLLRQTLNLFNSINYVATNKRVFIGVNKTLVPYAEAHNQGLNHQPQRQFMPYGNQKPNIKMLRAINKRVVYERDIALKAFKK